MRTLCIALLLSLVATSRGEGTARAAEEFYPTAVGTRWVMVTDYEDGSESYVDDIRITEVKVVNGYRKWRIRTVSRPRAANPLQAIANAFAPPNAEDVFDGWEYYDVGREAYVFRDLDEDYAGETLPLVYYPAEAQDVFEDEDGVVTTVIAVDEKVKVPAGEFRCIVYEIDYSGEGRTEVARNEPAGVNPKRLVPVLFDEEATEEAHTDAPGFPEEGDSEEEFEESATIVVEYWSKGIGLVRTEEFTIDEDGKRTLYSRQNLVSFHVPKTAGGTDPSPPTAKDK